jgi:hypothetical protein
MNSIDWHELAKNPVIQLIAAIVTISGAIFVFLKWILRWLQAAFSRLLARLTTKMPTCALAIVPSAHGSIWQMGTSNDKECMFASARVYVTNMSDVAALILGTRITWPRVAGNAVILAPQAGDQDSECIPPHVTAKVMAHFVIQPPVRRVGQDFKTTLILIDQFGKEHPLRGFIFPSLPIRKPVAAAKDRESVYAIEDQIEKEVVAVLQAELSRYTYCGRSVGGLGSVHIVYRGIAQRGVGTDAIVLGSHENQSIIQDPEAASLESDNLDALVGLYQSLPTTVDRERLISHLSTRLGTGLGYSSVAYFVVAAFYKIGRLRDVLAKIGHDLPDQADFALSNALMLIDGLLKFRYPDFPNDVLDQIQAALINVKEHKFKIDERIAAIRSRRLPKPGQGPA